mmetsp:Transcript_14958/g.21393  ORF Transcript_14958/g.21393 Transcript_14958/m.21393 type:complete len:124 (+) Transcript_14958:84-455(+)
MSTYARHSFLRGSRFTNSSYKKFFQNRYLCRSIIETKASPTSTILISSTLSPQSVPHLHFSNIAQTLGDERHINDINNNRNRDHKNLGENNKDKDTSNAANINGENNPSPKRRISEVRFISNK